MHSFETERRALTLNSRGVRFVYSPKWIGGKDGVRRMVLGGEEGYVGADRSGKAKTDEVWADRPVNLGENVV